MKTYINAKELLDTLYFDYEESENQTKLLTDNHTRFNITIGRDEKYIDLTFEYQCNTMYEYPTIKQCLYCYIGDAYGYLDSKVKNDECKTIDNFANNFGFESVSDCLKAFEGCKKAYNNIKHFFSDDETEALYNYFQGY